MGDEHLEAEGRGIGGRGARLRVARRLLGLCLVAGVLFVPALLTRAAQALGARRLALSSAAWLQTLWARASLRAMGVELDAGPGLPRGPYLVCANHQGYLDVLVLAACLPGRFVAMREIAGWPLLGWMARSSGTLFIDRQRGRDLLDVGPRLEETLAAGVNVLIFPEGRSGPGDRLLPLRSPLFEAAVRARVACLPVAVSYATPGIPWSTAWTVAWWGGMSFPRHAARLLALPRIVARVRAAGPPEEGADRKALAARIGAGLAGALPGVSLAPEPPDNPWSARAG